MNCECAVEALRFQSLVCISFLNVSMFEQYFHCVSVFLMFFLHFACLVSFSLCFYMCFIVFCVEYYKNCCSLSCFHRSMVIFCGCDDF